ncbi:MAG: hypothetical protein QNJ54_18200 [Prochloraceae cyanobacterium]|nr:hypothetical protein [Prochloraceae cyanobacterium]
MKDVLALIEQKKKKFAQLPLFEFMQDKSIDPRQRLAFAPCIAPFVMSFGELNKYAFREEPTSDPIQEIINKHTYEDDHHWIWLLEDLEKLGIDRALKFTDALRFLWSEETNISRRVAYELYRYTVQATPIQKLVVIEAAETTGNVFLSVSSQVVLELKSTSTTNQEYRYFGGGHLVVDTGHTYCSPKAKRFIESIQLTNEERTQYFQIVDKVFEVFTELTDEFLAYTKTHNISQPFTTKAQQEQPLKVALLTHR